MRTDEAIGLAKSLARLPRESVTPTIDEMTHSRTFSETVDALHMLVLDHSRYRPVAIAALENLACGHGLSIAIRFPPGEA